MPIHTSILTVGDGATVDVYAETVGDSIPVAQTLDHRVVLQNRTGKGLLYGDSDDLDASPATGLLLDDGTDATVKLRSPDRLFVRNTSGAGAASDLHVMIVTG